MIGFSNPTTLLLFSCLFDSYGVSSHRSHSYDHDSYHALQDLYAICVVDELLRPEKMVASLIIKTNIPFGVPGFLNGITTIIGLIPELASVTHEHCGLIPAPISVESAHPLSEDQALYVCKQLWSEHQAKQILHALPKMQAG